MVLREVLLDGLSKNCCVSRGIQTGAMQNKKQNKFAGQKFLQRLFFVVLGFFQRWFILAGN
ncbi:hypothetical protein [Achromobacter spanius]|uniref:hypothetical protein n=1 Tax=Achromobacter spanius TaxID=217203 RepID=UPI0011B06562|nr:hypothetical protein [Achromobacter spanius]